MQTDPCSRIDTTGTNICTDRVQKALTSRNEPSSNNPSLYCSRSSPHRVPYSGRLVEHWRTLLSNLGRLGTVHVETSNRDAVFQMTGRYAEFIPGTGLEMHHSLGDGRPLRFSLDKWHQGFAIKERYHGAITKSSIQFQDWKGAPIHTITLSKESDRDAFDNLTEKLKVPRNLDSGFSAASTGSKKWSHDQIFDIKEFRNRWLGVTSHHDHIHLTNQYGVSELQGLRMVGNTWASQVPVAAIYERLKLLVETQLPCTLELGNSGTLQSRRGDIPRMKFESGQLILSGDDWYFSIRLSEIHSAWVVTLPVSGRFENSIEFYNRYGQAITRIYGTLESVENAVWQDMLGTLPTIA